MYVIEDPHWKGAARVVILNAMAVPDTHAIGPRPDPGPGARQLERERRDVEADRTMVAGRREDAERRVAAAQEELAAIDEAGPWSPTRGRAFRMVLDGREAVTRPQAADLIANWTRTYDEAEASGTDRCTIGGVAIQTAMRMERDGSLTLRMSVPRHEPPVEMPLRAAVENVPLVVRRIQSLERQLEQRAELREQAVRERDEATAEVASADQELMQLDERTAQIDRALEAAQAPAAVAAPADPRAALAEEREAIDVRIAEIQRAFERESEELGATLEGAIAREMAAEETGALETDAENPGAAVDRAREALETAEESFRTEHEALRARARTIDRELAPPDADAKARRAGQVAAANFQSRGRASAGEAPASDPATELARLRASKRTFDLRRQSERRQAETKVTRAGQHASRLRDAIRQPGRPGDGAFAMTVDDEPVTERGDAAMRMADRRERMARYEPTAEVSVGRLGLVPIVATLGNRDQDLHLLVSVKGHRDATEVGIPLADVAGDGAALITALEGKVAAVLPTLLGEAESRRTTASAELQDLRDVHRRTPFPHAERLSALEAARQATPEVRADALAAQRLAGASSVPHQPGAEPVPVSRGDRPPGSQSQPVKVKSTLGVG